jgi:arginine utilization protein RocB
MKSEVGPAVAMALRIKMSAFQLIYYSIFFLSKLSLIYEKKKLAVMFFSGIYCPSTRMNIFHKKNFLVFDVLRE